MIFLILFLTFFKIGLVTFGGGYAMLPLIQADVLKNNWLSSKELIDFIAVSESTPGPFAVNISTYIGMTVKGFLGSVCATLGVVLPSFIVILMIASVYEKFKKSRIVNGAMTGLRPAVVGMIGSAIISVGRTVFFNAGFSTMVFKSASFYISAGIFIVMLIMAFKKVHPIIIILLSAVIGIAAGISGIVPV